LKKEEAKEQLQLQPPPEGAVLIKTNFNFPLENFQSPLIASVFSYHSDAETPILVL